MDATGKQRKRKIRLPEHTRDLSDILHESGRTDSANAERFIDSNESRLLYVPEWGRWLHWDGRRWHDDSNVGIWQRAKQHAKSLWSLLVDHAPNVDRDELGTLQSFIKASNQLGKILAFVKLAESDKRIVCPVSALNQHHARLNVLNGTVDLETGELRKHDPADRITQLANVRFDAAATCPEWEAAISLIFAADQALIRFVQQLLGYSISGLTIEEILALCYGDGGNGKSTIWNTVSELLGDYARAASQDLILPEKSQHPEIIAALKDKRFVTISEPEGGRELRESTAKMLSSTDKIEAREMFGTRHEFKPTHKIWIPTNHKPRIKGNDQGIWRRVKLIPFVVEIKKLVKPRKGFHHWLVANEGPGILNWLIRGFQDYRANGLIEPQAVTDATNEYREESDALGVFLREHCVQEPGAVATANELFECYQSQHGGKWSKTAFGRSMAERFEKTKGWEGATRGKIVYQGVRLAGENDVCNQLQPVSQVSIRDLANSIETPAELGATSCNLDLGAKPAFNEDEFFGAEQ